MMYELGIDPESGKIRESRTIATTNAILKTDVASMHPTFFEKQEIKTTNPFLEAMSFSFDSPLGPSRMLFANLPHPKHVMVNGDYTTVVWEDGSHTVVKKMDGDTDDPEKAIMYAIFKRMFYHEGSAMKRYFKEFEDKTIVKKKEDKNDRKRNNRKGKSKAR